MSKKILLLLFSMVFIFTLYCEQTDNIKNHPKGNSKKENYTILWKQVIKFKTKGLPKSALKIINKIYNKAKYEKNSGEVLKSLLYKFNYLQKVSEGTLIKIQSELKKELSSNSAPIKQVIHSIIAEQYWHYYERNRYKFLNRTKLTKYKEDDMQTWDINKIVERVLYHYKQSLTDTDILKKTNTALISKILYRGNYYGKLRPTLFDFLSHRAINFFANSESSITKPIDTFSLNNKKFLSSYNNFIKIKLKTNDPMAFKYYALKYLQDLLIFHKEDKSSEALVDVDIKRLKFVHSHGIIANKDNMYINALKDMLNLFNKSSVCSEINYELASFYNSLSKNYIPRRAEKYRWYKKKAVDLCNKIIKDYPNTNVTINAIALIDKIKQKYLILSTDEVIIPNKPILSLLEYKNIENVYFKLVKTNKAEIKSMKYKRKENTVKFLNNKRALRLWSMKLPQLSDYQLHRSEIKLNKLKTGLYYILISNKKNFDLNSGFVAYTDIKVSSISYTYNVKKNNDFEIYILNRNSGQTIKNAKAQLWRRVYNRKKQAYELRKQKLYKFTNGYLNIPFNKGFNKKNKSFYLEFITDKERCFANGSFDNYYYPYNNTVNTKTFFFTDRAIYRPGQNIYFKGIMLKVNYINGEKNKILKNYDSTITFYDVNNQKISALKVRSNEFGTFSGSFSIPLGLLNGTMRISDSYGTKYISIEEYKRPKFKVNFKKTDKNYRLGNTVSVKGFAKAYAGYNIDNAKVRYRIKRSNFYPYRWYYWNYSPSSNEMEIKNGFTKTDKNGNFLIKFNAIPDYSVEINNGTAYKYTVFVDVTDMNGETRKAEKTFFIGKTSLKLSINTPSLINREKSRQFTINSTDLSGNFISTKINVKILKLIEPNRFFKKKLWNKTQDIDILKKKDYIKFFPYEAYDDENNIYKFKVKNQVYTKTIDTGKVRKLNLKGINKWETGRYRLILNAKDKFGNSIKEIKHFILYSKYDKKPPVKTLDWFVNINPTVHPGNKAEFLIGSSDKKVRILFETCYRRKFISRKIIRLNNEQKLIIIPIKEKHRGNISFNFTFIKRNRRFNHEATIYVPWTNKKLNISFETFRDKLLPGEKEEWKLKIRGKNGEHFVSEMVATLYDTSLDSFKQHNWAFSIYPSLYCETLWQDSDDFYINNTLLTGLTRKYSRGYSKNYDRINWFGFYLRGYINYRRTKSRMYKKVMSMSTRRDRVSHDKENEEQTIVAAGLAPKFEKKKKGGSIKKEKNGNHKTTSLPKVKVRTNLKETAFFYPHLRTNSKGEILISFTIPEALTKWKMLGFAHTKDLKFGLITNELKTQKDLMVVPNAPRFLREKDRMVFTSKVINLSKENLSGTAQLVFLDPHTMKPVDNKFNNIKNKVNFTVKKGQSNLIKWKIKIPEDLDAVIWRVIAKAGNYSDGEENLLPILKNRMLVTESLPLPLKPNETKIFKFKKLLKSKSSTTIKHHKLTLEFTSNPVWYAVQSLPYLMEYPYECSEQTFSRFYANSIAQHIVNSMPEIKRVFNIWKKLKSSDALLSKLEKNQELKSLLLEETPWVREAKNETESKKRIALLFDLNKMSKELNKTLRKLEDNQMASGGWPWFKGMRENRYITQYIVSGFAHLKALNVLNKKYSIKINRMTRKAMRWLDYKIKEDYDWLVEHKINLILNHLNNTQIHYLYARSYFKDITLASSCKKAFEYYKSLSIKYWLDYNKYGQGMIALFLNRYEHKNTAKDILKSIKEHAIYSDEMGMYWKGSYDYNWYRAPIEMHALLIEAFSEILDDKESVSALKTWLLKSKQTQNWKTTKATAEACYALLLNGDNWLKENKLPEITVGNIKIEPEKTDNINIEAGTGYFKTSWSNSEIKPEMGNIKIKNNNKITAWGAVYWQYFEDLDKITPAKTPLSLKKELFIERYGKTGPELIPLSKSKPKIGDRIKVRIELRVDRDMEYIHMKDMRASGFEPENVISRYKWQDGLGYYESTKDGSTNFFIDYLRKGTYVFEYPLRITHKGDFSNGITIIQSMYAPEFSSHSKGVRVKINY